MLTLLSAVTKLCERQGLPLPNTVFGSTDKQVTQARAILEEALESLAERGAWEALINEATWTTVAVASQGAITSIATNGYNYIIPETLWNRDEQIPLVGAQSPREWQKLQAVVITGPHYTFRLRGGLLLVDPAPTAGQTWAFEYVSKNFILQADNTTYLSAFAADGDQILLPDKVVLAELRWRWKREKGLSYDEEFNTAEKLIADTLGRDKPGKVLHLDDGGLDARPAIAVPVGSFNL